MTARRIVAQVGALFSQSTEFRRVLHLRDLDLELLASELRFPPTQAPTVEWLHAFWTTVTKHAVSYTGGIGTVDLLRLSQDRKSVV